MAKLIPRRLPGQPNGGRALPPGDPTASPSHEDAWRTLMLVVDWIKHAESKATATLATAGLAAGLLFTVVSQVKTRDGFFLAAAVASAAAITGAAVAAGVAIFPRLRSRGKPGGLIFYRGITDGFGDDPDGFVAAYTALAADRAALFAAVAKQIWANANVASRKYEALNWAVAILLVALVLLAVTAVLGLLSS